MKNQKGFTAVEVVLVVLLLIAIGAAGYFAFQASKKSSVATSPSPTTLPSVRPSPTTQISYLSVKEWGVKIPMLPNGNSLSYQYYTGVAQDGDAVFVSAEQKALGGDCGTIPFARYSVAREPKGYQPAAEEPQLTSAASEGDTVTIGNYTYFIVYDASGGACDPNQKTGEPMTQAETNANNDLMNDLKGMIAQ